MVTSHHIYVYVLSSALRREDVSLQRKRFHGGTKWREGRSPEPGGRAHNDVISFQTEPNYINEIVLHGNAFLQVGLNSVFVRVAPAGEPGDGYAQKVDYLICEETQGQEPAAF